MLACFATPPKPDELDFILTHAGVLPAAIHPAIQHVSMDAADPALQSVRIPVLVMHGERDGLVLPAMGQRTAGLIPGAKFSLFPNFGHAPFFDDTPRFNEELARFVTVNP